MKRENDLRKSLHAGVKKLKKHGKAVITALTASRAGKLDGICSRGIDQLKRNASSLAAGLTPKK